ncbi:hypothetical protein ACQP3F_31445, partial [Escherichia coli]
MNVSESGNVAFKHYRSINDDLCSHPSSHLPSPSLLSHPRPSLSLQKKKATEMMISLAPSVWLFLYVKILVA